MNGTASSSTFDGRCVNTIVFSSPKRAPRRAAATDDAACSSPAPKNTRPRVSTLTPNFRWSQNTRKVCTTKPPPNESSANSAASRRMVELGARLGIGAAGAGELPRPSIAGDSLDARTAQAMASAGNTNRNRWSAGSPGYRWRNQAGPPAASAPTAPAR